MGAGDFDLRSRRRRIDGLGLLCHLHVAVDYHRQVDVAAPGDALREVTAASARKGYTPRKLQSLLPGSDGSSLTRSLGLCAVLVLGERVEDNVLRPAVLAGF